MMLIIFMGTGIWCALAIYLAVQDARFRLLPWTPTGLAAIVGLLVGLFAHALGSGSTWWVWHVGVSLALLAGGGLLWLMGGLGLGDVMAWGIFGLVFGFIGAILIIGLSFFAMAIVVVIRGLRHLSIRDMPIGIALWLFSIPTWLLTMIIIPRIGGII